VRLEIAPEVPVARAPAADRADRACARARRWPQTLPPTGTRLGVSTSPTTESPSTGDSDTVVVVGAYRARILVNGLGYQRASWEIWSTFPQVSFSWAMVEPVTSVGGIVNSAPRALMRSYSPLMSSLKNMAAG
jgi:hypothetical protein